MADCFLTTPQSFIRQHAASIFWQVLLVLEHTFFFFAPGCHAYIVTRGHLTYTHELESAHVELVMKESIRAANWICEMCLWFDWMHVGTMEALTSSQAMAINARKTTLGILDQTTLTGALFRSYGRAYHARLVAAKPPMSNWPNDLRVSTTDFEDVIDSAGFPIRVCFGMLASRVFGEGWQGVFNSSDPGHLQQEVLSGSSTLMLNQRVMLNTSVGRVCLHREWRQDFVQSCHPYSL